MIYKPTEADTDIEATNWLLNEGYKSRAAALMPKKAKKKHPAYTVKDFVDTCKAVEGTSGSEEEDFMAKAKSKAAKEELMSEVPNPRGIEV